MYIFDILPSTGDENMLAVSDLVEAVETRCSSGLCDDC